MRYVQAGGERVSAIGLGTWQFGSREWGYGSHYAEHDAVDIVNHALDLGINLIDTAEIYGFGRSERIVGRAIAERRSEVFLATKVFPLLPLRSVVAKRAAGSARRLGIGQIDLYQLHQPNPVVSLNEQMAAMRGIQRSGVIRQIGVSNYTLERWQAAEAALGGPVWSNQVRFNLVDRRPLQAMTKWAADNDRVVIAYSPLAQGLLSGRYDAEHRPTAMRASSPAFLPENLDRARLLLRTLKEIADAHDATSAQVALAWVISHPNVVAIPGASTVAQLQRNADAADLELSAEETHRLMDAAEAYRPVQGVAAVPGLVRTWSETLRHKR
ncbi:MAG: aldo/keto reductase [Acidimicrobiales bacterium]|jgi:aryl-alcohol dehydrogenase-like predicted oxidoreductase